MNDLFKESAKISGPVECLGQTFANDEARREHFLNILREKLKDSVFRKIEGFPVGTDEAILAMSDPPFYTACPNPFLEDFVRHYGKPYDPSVKYSREPQTIDVSVGKPARRFVPTTPTCKNVSLEMLSLSTPVPSIKTTPWIYLPAS